MTTTPGSERVFVLGLDGVPWGMLRDWAEAGELPAFARLFEDGAAGPLQSTTPATTALAWPAISTGVWPDRYGVYAFQRLTSEHSHRMNTSRDVTEPALWDVLTPAVVGNVPMTYPASAIDGTMVTGLLTPDSRQGFTHPTSVAAEIEARIPDYRIGLDWATFQGHPDEFVAELEDLVRTRRELLAYLMETDDWRLFYFVFTAPDRLQHLVWDPPKLLSLYRRLDDVLADVLEYVEERDATLFVVSDHGFGPVERDVHVNTSLADGGYLTPRMDGESRALFGRLGVTRERVRAALKTVGLDEKTLVRVLPRQFVDAVASSVPGDHALYDVDFTRTKAFMHGPGNVYVNDTERFDPGAVAPENVRAVADEVATFLATVTDPETGEQVLTVHDGDDLFPRDPFAPDLVVTAEGYVPRARLATTVLTPTEMAADHRSEGIVFAYGPTIRSGARIDGATVVDVAPTALHCAGAPIPEGTDGHVLSDLFAPGSEPATRLVETETYGSSSGDDVDSDFTDVEERLRGLGYME